MKNIQILVGISNSGKSTYAHKLWKKNPQEIVIINRDKIRELKFGYTEQTILEYYKREDINKLEKQITKYEDLLIHEALAENKIVIIDATHLSLKYIKKHEYWNVPIELIWFDITLKEALTRNMSRNRKVKEEVIFTQYNKYCNLRKELLSYSFSPKKLEQDSTLPKCWVFDIDNTLAHKGTRNAFDWKKVGEDTLDKSVGLLCQIIQEDIKGSEVIFCSGRDEVCRKDTEYWIRANNLNKSQNFTLLMRKENDMRSDDIVKEELWQEILKTRSIIALIDDRNSVCRRARALGLKVFQVEYGNF
jgi:predicted kinase